MRNSEGIKVLIIDDRSGPEDEALRIDIEEAGGTVELRHPDELDGPDALRGARVVVLDEFLEEWPGRDASYRGLDEGAPRPLPVSLRPPDGVSLAAVLRQHLQEQDVVVPIVVRTSDLEKLTDGMPTGQREHLFARQRDLEWVMSKREPHQPPIDGATGAGPPSPRIPTAVRLTSLARAMDGLPQSWTDIPTIAEWLRLPRGTAWEDVARFHIARCRPPRASLTKTSRGRDLLRWLLQQVLPHPTFLIGPYHLAARAGLDDKAVPALSAVGPVGAPFTAARYTGPLHDFLGPRWWRAAVDNLLDDAGSANLPHSGATVVVLDAELSFAGLVDRRETWRIVPDDWPPFADSAYALKTDVGNDGELHHLMVIAESERWRVQR